MTGMLLGCVLMMLGPHGRWHVYDPWGNEIAVPATDECQGLQTAVDWAILHGFSLKVQGGTEVGNRDPAVINCGNTLWISAAAKINIEMIGITLAFLDPRAVDGILFDSFDMMNFRFVGGQIVYGGTSAAIKIRPTNFFQEGNDKFFVATSSSIWIQTIAIVDPATWYPQRRVNGNAIIFEPTGPITYNEITINEVNGGTIPILTLPGTNGGYFGQNKVAVNFAH